MSNCSSCGQNIPEGARFCGACGHQTLAVPARKGLVGSVIADRYRVLRVIAEGGMGIVYEAEQPMGEGLRRVAIKTLLPELSRDPVVVSRFNRECSVVAGLEHPNTVRVYDFGAIEDGSLYIAMEFVAGRSLGELIAEGPIPLQRCLGIMEQIASALEEAHGQGIIHRDLKPDNIVLSDRAGLHDFVKVLDFGIAKRSSVGGKHDTNLTQQGMVLGTPPYMSPEQFTGEPLDRTSDIYSLGIIFYEMMNAKLPFDGGDTPWQWAHQHISVEPARFAVPVSNELEEVVRSALSKQRSARPQSALEFYRRLCAASGATPGARSRMIEPPQPDLSRASTLAKGGTSPDVPALGPRTEPSMLRSPMDSYAPDARGDSSFARGTTAPAAPALSFVGQSGTGTDPGGPRFAAGLSIAHPSAVIAPPPTRAGRGRRRRIGGWVAGLLLSLIGLGAAAAGIWWVSTQPANSGEPPRPAASSLASSVVEIAAESTPQPANVPVGSTKPAPGAVSQPGAAAPRPQPPVTTHPAPQASSTSTTQPQSSSAPPSNANPFPLPFPITLPSVLTPTGLPPLGLPTAATPSTPAPTPNPAQPAPANPAAGLQQCNQASTLADTDLDAAVGQYQLCENAVGRNAATPARAKIASVGLARAAALASQGRCDEAQRVVTTLSRIGVHRNAQRAMEKAGCRT